MDHGNGTQGEEIDSTRTRSVERGGRILASIGEAGGELGLSAISRAANVEKPTALRILRSLVASRLLTYVPERQSYQLGPETLRLGLIAAERIPLRALARPTLEQLRNLANESIGLYTRIGRFISTIDAAVAHRDPKAFPGVLGSIRPLHLSGNAGLVLLAFESRAFVEHYIARELDPTGEDSAPLLRQLADVRACGYARGFRRPFSGVAFPLINADDQVVGSIAVMGPPDRLTNEVITDQLPQFLTIIYELQTRLALLPPIDPYP